MVPRYCYYYVILYYITLYDIICFYVTDSRLDDQGSILVKNRNVFLLATTREPALGPTHPLLQRLLRSRLEDKAAGALT
jgi:hypothetical protein